MQETLVVECSLVLRVDGEAGVVVGQGFLDLVEALVGVAPIVVGVGVGRVEGDALGGVFDGFAVLLLLDLPLALGKTDLGLLPLVVWYLLEEAESSFYLMKHS